jgi:hypothetical protein
VVTGALVASVGAAGALGYVSQVGGTTAADGTSAGSTSQSRSQGVSSGTTSGGSHAKSKGS